MWDAMPEGRRVEALAPGSCIVHVGSALSCKRGHSASTRNCGMPTQRSAFMTDDGHRDVATVSV
jgi:hypothetical protein